MPRVLSLVTDDFKGVISLRSAGLKTECLRQGYLAERIGGGVHSSHFSWFSHFLAVPRYVS
jgi:hypothetical protein